ncbi:MAG: SGNH/GDSL hydrolase family protein [Bradymonadia bacterium]
MSSNDKENRELVTQNLRSIRVTRTLSPLVVCFAVLLSVLTTQAMPADESESRPKPVATPFKRVLILGDSHVMGHFGKSLVSQLSTVMPDALIRLIGVCGGSERGLLTGFRTKCGLLKRNERGRVHIPKQCRRNRCDGLSDAQCKEIICRPNKLKTAIARFRPDLVIFQLGSNSMWMGKPNTNWKRNRKVLKRYVRFLKKSPRACVWVTPPDSMTRSGADQDAFALIYEEELSEVCRVFNSRPHQRPYLDYRQLARNAKTKRIKHDRVHYGWFGSKGRHVQEKWARDVVAFIVSPTSQASQAEDSAPIADKTNEPRHLLLDMAMRWVKRLNRHLNELRASGLLRARGPTAKPVEPLSPR